MSDIQNIKKEKCSGCGACYNICPVKAIKMEKNEEGFLYPVIDKEKCTNCGLCLKICPAENQYVKNSKHPKCVACMADDEIRKNSTSGGIFPMLANFILQNKGYVSGAVWEEDYSVKHIVSNKIEDIKKMCESKYLQSDTNTCYSQIKEILITGVPVLFTGCSCQVAGLRNYLQQDYNNLYCIDIICHGVPSSKVFQKYINEEHLLKNGEKWLHTNFRDKVNGWNSTLRSTTTTTNTTTTKLASKDTYLRAFLNNLSLRKSCGSCTFRSLPLQGDITIGDFWGVDEYDKSLNDSKGTSILLLNNNKGAELFNIIKSSFKVSAEVPIEAVLEGNPHLIHSDITKNPNRKLFFELLDKTKLKDNIDTCLNDVCDYLIVNFGWSWYNYGANITAYAMQELVKSFGYVPKLLLNYEKVNKNIGSRAFDFFADNFLDYTKNYSLSESNILTKNIRGVILGSDQVLRYEYIMGNNSNKYLLNFVDDSCKKIALSASFGFDLKEFLNDRFNKKNISKMKYALKSFDYLSTRELSGQDIMKKVFQLNSDMILDPVFLINKNKYTEIINASDKDFSNKIISYVLDKNSRYYSFCNYIEGKYNNKIYDINIEKDNIEDWLKAIYEAKLFITDSFHGVCFAIIFNKPFVCIRNKMRGDSRFKSLIDIFGIKDNFIFDIDEIYTSDINFMPDYEKISKILNSEKERCLNIIQKVLNEGYSNNKNSVKYKKINRFMLILNFLSFKNISKYIKMYIKYKRYCIMAKYKNKKRQHYMDKKNKLKLELNDMIYADYRGGGEGSK